jgi:hypothetical protein
MRIHPETSLHPETSQKTSLQRRTLFVQNIDTGFDSFTRQFKDGAHCIITRFETAHRRELIAFSLRKTKLRIDPMDRTWRFLEVLSSVTGPGQDNDLIGRGRLSF